MPEPFSPPTTTSDSTGSPYPAQQLGIYLPSPPTAASGQMYFGGTPSPMPHEDNPRDQFASWGGMAPVMPMGQHLTRPDMHRTNS